MNQAEPLPAYTPVRIDDRAAWERIRDRMQSAGVEPPGVETLTLVPPRPTLPAATDYLASIRANDRGTTDRIFSNQRVTLGELVLHRLLEGPRDDDRLLNWLWDVATQPSWTPAAHTPGRTVPRSDQHVIELVSCDMAMLLAEVADALRPWLAAQCKPLAETLPLEVERRIVKPFGDGAEAWWHPLDGKPGRLLNNWTGVCAGAILSAALALERLGRPQPKAIERAIDALGDFFRGAFTESGECDEGIGYWNYGVFVACFGLCCLPADRLAKAVDRDRLAQVADYPRRAHLFGDVFFCSNDGNPKNSIAPICGTWLAEVTGNDFLRWWNQQSPPRGKRGLPELLRLMAFVPDRKPDPLPAPRHEPARLLLDQQVAIFQRSLHGRTVSCTIEGGHNAENHNHNDLGTIQLWINDGVLIPDLGKPEYTSDFFGPKRYTYLVPSSGGHCCPLVNGHEQRPGRDAATRNARFSPETGEMSLELTAAYPAEAGLKKWVRSLHAPPNDADVTELSDEFVLQSDGTIVHRLWLVDEPRLEDGASASVPGLTLRLEPRPDALKVSEFNAGELRLNSFAASRSLYRLEASYHAKAGQPLVIATRIRVRPT